MISSSFSGAFSDAFCSKSKTYCYYYVLCSFSENLFPFLNVFPKFYSQRHFFLHVNIIKTDKTCSVLTADEYFCFHCMG